MERTRETSIRLGENKEDTYGNRWQTRRIRGPNKHLERRTARERERKKERKKKRKTERKKEGHEMETTRTTSTETDKGQGASCAPEAPRENNSNEERSVKTSWEQAERRARKQMGHKESPVPKATKRRTLSAGGSSRTNKETSS